MSETKERSPEEIREDIERTREELGETAAAAAEKADVKKQAKAKVGGAREKAAAKAEEVKQTATATKDEVADKAQQVAPAAAGDAAQRAQQFARENPLPLAIAGAFVAGYAIAMLRSRGADPRGGRPWPREHDNRETTPGRTGVPRMRLAATTGQPALKRRRAGSRPSGELRPNLARTTSPTGPPP